MNEVVQIVEGQTKRHRAQIIKISEQAYRVDVERLYDAHDADGIKRGEYWFTLKDWTSYTDSLDRALELADENIRISEYSDVTYG